MSNNSFRDILKSTGLVGFFQVFKMFLGLLRNKLIALFMGTTGIGIWGLYLSFTELIQGISSLGLEKSTVKMVSENKGDLKERNISIKIAQLTFITFSLFCSIVAASFSEYFSINLFGSKDYQTGILICCLVIFLNSLTSISIAILNGLREIKKLIYSQLVGVLVGNVIVLCLIPFLGSNAIPLYLLIIALFAFIPVFFSFRKLKISNVRLTFKEAFSKFTTLMKVGLAFWFTIVFTTLIAYLTKVFLLNELSVEVVGIYQASWTISNLYVGIILSAMGVDFFPKICDAIINKKDTNSIINEQIEFGLLVSFPFILGTLIFAPTIITLLFSSEFSSGDSIIRWQILGVLIRLLGFPFGYAIMAKGKTKQFMIAQFAFNSFNYLFIVLLVFYVGFDGLGINYFLAYIFYVVIIGFYCFKYLNYTPSKYLLKLLFVILLFLLSSLLTIYLFENLIVNLLGLFILLISFYYSYIQLTIKLNFNVIDFIKSKIKK